MKLSTRQISREIDRRTIEEFGVPGVVLMENAGRAVASAILAEYPSARKMAVICGGGNNAGDGFVIARHLISSGNDVSIHIAQKKQRYKGDAKTNLDSLLEIGGDVRELEGKLPRIKGTDIIIDAIFGTGLDRDVGGFYERLIKFINRQSVPCVSVDIPSGLDADTGQPMGAAVRADVTVTFAPPKLGMCVYPGVDYAGKLCVADITIPKLLEEDIPFELLTFQKCAGLIRKRTADSHKGTYGHILVLAGSPGKSGAAILCAEAALRAGSGLVTLGVPESISTAVEEKTTEVMSVSLKDSKDGSFHSDAHEEALRELDERKSALAVGPGISTSKSAGKFLEKVITQCEVPVVLDADALNIISKNPEDSEENKSSRGSYPPSRRDGKTVQHRNKTGAGRPRRGLNPVLRKVRLLRRPKGRKNRRLNPRRRGVHKPHWEFRHGNGRDRRRAHGNNRGACGAGIRLPSVLPPGRFPPRPRG